MAHILVIDDERSIRNTLKEILEYEKFTVDLAEHGADAILPVLARPGLLRLAADELFLARTSHHGA